MKEREFRAFDIGNAISNLEASPNPTHIQIVESLKELITSGAYNICRTSDEPGPVQVARIIIKQPDSTLVSVVSDFSGEDLERKKYKQLVNTIRKENKELPSISIWLANEEESLALNILEEAQLKTVAAMIILKGRMTGYQIVQVCYPRVFMNLDHSIPPSRKEELGLAVAVHFLKKVTV